MEDKKNSAANQRTLSSLIIWICKVLLVFFLCGLIFLAGFVTGGQAGTTLEVMRQESKKCNLRFLNEQVSWKVVAISPNGFVVKNNDMKMLYLPDGCVLNPDKTLGELKEMMLDSGWTIKPTKIIQKKTGEPFGSPIFLGI